MLQRSFFVDKRLSFSGYIHELYSVLDNSAVGFMNMAENVIFRLYLLYLFEEMLRASMVLSVCHIKDSKRRRMRDQNINLLRQSAPHLLVFFFPILECPFGVFYSIRRAKYLDPLDLYKIMLQVNTSLFQLIYYCLLGQLYNVSPTLQGNLNSIFYLATAFILSSIDISWLPAMTILCLKFNCSNRSKNLQKHSSFPYRVKSPAKMKRSPVWLLQIRFYIYQDEE